jgi:LuxR family maltose regulon positive regulatory protein
MKDSDLSPLVLTKLRVPVVRSGTVARARLFERLEEPAAHFLLVCAPAGYGKTTFLAQWARCWQERRAPVAWYGLDSGDDNPNQFGAYLVASFVQALGPAPDLVRMAQSLRSSTETDLQRVIGSIINAAAVFDRTCVLVLDDYHLIGSPAIHSAVAYLVEHLPENLHLVLGSRSDPPFPLARLRVQRRMAELRADGLRFTPEETTEYLNESMQLCLSEQGVSELTARTEGWIAGLQLAALSLSNREDKEGFIASFSGVNRYLVEYLMEEVISRQPPEVQLFLLSTSVLERISASLCGALVGETIDSEAVLTGLEQANLFMVNLDDQGQWFRYHHLFREFLRARLEKTRSGEIAGLHRAACEWLALNGYLREAANHAFQTGNWDYAAGFVEQHSFDMIVHSDISTMYEWCSAFPEEVMQRHPMLYIHQCWALVMSFRRQHRARVEARLQQVERAAEQLGENPQADALRENAAVLRSLQALAPDPTVDPQPYLRIADELLGDYPEGNPGQFSGLLYAGYAFMALHDAQNARQILEKAQRSAQAGRLYFGMAESAYHLARLAYFQGQLRRSMEICRQAQAEIGALMSGSEQDLPALGALDIAMGCVLLEWNRLDEAEECLLRGLDRAGWGVNPYYLVTANTALFRLREFQGRRDEALKYLDQIETAWPDVDFYLQGLRVEITLREEQKDAAAATAAWRQAYAALVRERPRAPGMGPLGGADLYYTADLAWARAEIALGDPREALIVIERQLVLAGKHDLNLRVIELSLLQVLAHGRLVGEPEAAQVALERALGLSQSEDALRIFDREPALMELLRTAAESGGHQAHARRILAVLSPEGSRESIRAAATDSALQANMQRVEPLSERELQVLRLLACGATNRDIAEEFVISVGTVKSHINHILGKLEAHNRTEAVARARAAGLLDL